MKFHIDINNNQLLKTIWEQTYEKKKKKKEREKDIIKLIYLHLLYGHSYFFFISHFQSEEKKF
jgi:hypothetical protein